MTRDRRPARRSRGVDGVRLRTAGLRPPSARMARMRGTLGGSAAVAAATALLGIALASGPLYVSSAASEAVQVGLARTCPSDAGLVVGVPPFLDASVLDRLDDLAAPVDHVEAPI